MHTESQPNPEPAEMTVEKKIPPPDLLQGVVISLSQKLAHREAELHEMALKLGAELYSSFSETCTHYMHQSNKPNEKTKDFKTARAKGKSIVSPAWLVKCFELGQRVNEGDFPHTYNPNKSLSIMSSQSAPIKRPEPSSPSSSQLSAKRAGKRSAPAVKQEPMPAVAVTTPQVSQTVKRAATTMVASPSMEDKGISERLAEAVDKFAADMSKERRKRHRPASTTPATFGATLSTFSRDSAASSICDEDPADIAPVEVELLTQHTQAEKRRLDAEYEEGDSVVYDDPEGRIAQQNLLEFVTKKRRRLSPSNDGKGEAGPAGSVTAAQLAAIDQSTQLRPSIPETGKPTSVTSHRSEPSGQTTPVLQKGPELTKTTSEASSLSHSFGARTTESNGKATTLRRFLITGVPPADRHKIATVIRKLGGECLDRENWTSECTHLIVAKPTRTEKCLAALAAGVWCLKPQYVDACSKSGRFVDEPAFEWTSMDAGEAALLSAPRRWRLQLGNYRDPSASRKGAFEGFKVLLVVENKKKDGFVRVLQAGGAVVDVGKVPYRNVELDFIRQGYTHCFTDRDPQLLSQYAGIKALAAAGTAIVDVSYCAEYLTGEPTPSPGRWLVNLP
ncbi:DNA topoisomerase 2-binding protein 1 [Borealophlyctis nickersoniae]|nr:DNA topoisomerase 2-binding protein 1 [Borealophlyctis nickersoniae]